MTRATQIRRARSDSDTPTPHRRCLKRLRWAQPKNTRPPSQRGRRNVTELSRPGPSRRNASEPKKRNQGLYKLDVRRARAHVKPQAVPRDHTAAVVFENCVIFFFVARAEPRDARDGLIASRADPRGVEGKNRPGSPPYEIGPGEEWEDASRMRSCFARFFERRQSFSGRHPRWCDPGQIEKRANPYSLAGARAQLRKP